MLHQYTRKQHYLPKSYLQFFATPGKNQKMIYAYFIKQDKLQYVDIDTVCMEKDLYETKICISGDEKEKVWRPNELEKSFVGFEGIYASIMQAFVNTEDEKKFGFVEYHKEILSLFFAWCTFRNPDFINIVKALSSCQFSNLQIHENTISLKEIVHNAMMDFISPNGRCIFPRALARTTQDSKLCLLKASRSGFITSDIPLLNIYGDKNGTEYDLVGIPVTPEYFVAFVDIDASIPSTVQLNDYETSSLNRRQFISRKPKVLMAKNKESLSDLILR